MSGSFDILGGEITIKSGSRTTFTTEGTLVNLLPSSFNYVDTVSVEFPQVLKTKLYRHNWSIASVGFDNDWGMGSAGQAWIGARPQEYSNVTVLESAPAGVDFVQVFLRLSRTKAPTHTWSGLPIEVMPILGQYIPFSGSTMLETGLGFARAASIYLSGGNLVLHKQQSVMKVPAGFGSVAGGTLSNRYGTDWYGNPNQGLPVWIGGAGSQTADQKFIKAGPGGPSTSLRLRTADFGGPNQAVITDATDYRSTWEFDIIAKYGRRS